MTTGINAGTFMSVEAATREMGENEDLGHIYPKRNMQVYLVVEFLPMKL